MTRDKAEPTIEMQGQKYYGLSGIAHYVRDMAFDDRPPYPYVALGLKEVEDYEHKRWDRDIGEAESSD
jgi:hypothetical protein